MTDGVALRLIRNSDAPLSHEFEEALEFGLQDTKQAIAPGRLDENGWFVFDFVLTAKPGPDPARPNFTGRYASGSRDDRFVYLSWRSVSRGVWVNRLKARLGSIDWSMIAAARAAGRPLEADLSDWRLGDPRKFVDWRLARR